LRQPRSLQAIRSKSTKFSFKYSTKDKKNDRICLTLTDFCPLGCYRPIKNINFMQNSPKNPFFFKVKRYCNPKLAKIKKWSFQKHHFAKFWPKTFWLSPEIIFFRTSSGHKSVKDSLPKTLNFFPAQTTPSRSLNLLEKEGLTLLIQRCCCSQKGTAYLFLSGRMSKFPFFLLFLLFFGGSIYLVN